MIQFLLTVKQFQVSQFNTKNFNIRLHSVKWFQAWLFITYKSMKQSFISQRDVFLTNQFNVRYLHAHSLTVK